MSKFGQACSMEVLPGTGEPHRQDFGYWDLGPMKLGYWDMGPLKLGYLGYWEPYV